MKLRGIKNSQLLAGALAAEPQNIIEWIEDGSQFSF